MSETTSTWRCKKCNAGVDDEAMEWRDKLCIPCTELFWAWSMAEQKRPKDYQGYTHTAGVGLSYEIHSTDTNTQVILDEWLATQTRAEIDAGPLVAPTKE